MATDSVSLSEITNIKGDAQNAYGSTPGGTDVVLPFNQGLQFMSYAARAKAEADQFKYLQFQSNLKDFYKQWDDVKVDGIMEADYPEINKEYAQLAGEIAANYDILRNPNRDPEKYAELKQREAELRGRISRSKQDVAYRDAHKKFVTSHPEFNTEANNKAIGDFDTKKIGERQTFNLSSPFSYDPIPRAKLANATALRTYKEDIASGRYITSLEKREHLKDVYLNAWRATRAAQDRFGRPIIEGAADAYGKIYGERLRSGKTIEDIDDEEGLSFLEQTQEFATLREDPVAAQEDQQRFTAGENAKNRSLQRDLSEDKTGALAGRIYNEAITAAFTNGNIPSDVAQAIYGDDNEVQVNNAEQQEIKREDGTGSGVFTPTGKTTITKVPRIQVTGTTYDPVTQELIINRVDNSSGKPVPIEPIKRSFDQARTEFYKIAGGKNVDKVADQAQKFRRDNGLGENPDLPKMREWFKFGTDNAIAEPPAATTPTVKRVKGI